MSKKVLGGRYEVQSTIGGGGMAVVYRALDTLLDRVVAVKMLRSEFSEDDEFVARFRQEAQSAARLSHPNIVNVYDVGVDGNDYYIVMEYVDGQTLKDVIVERGPLPVEEVIKISLQICAALSQAHQQNIIHRDVKPHNILVNRMGIVKVTDFGIARAVTGNTITEKQATSVLGSVHYFSPEQARGAQTDSKSDIYSLGVVMYEMLTGSLPFSGSSPVSVALKHLREHFVEPREINRSIPQSVENIVLRCMVKSVDGRYPDMAAVEFDLEQALRHPNVAKFQMPAEYNDETIAVPVVGDGFSDVSPEIRKEGRKPLRRFALYASIIVIAMAALGVGGYTAINVVTNLVKVSNLTLPSVIGKQSSAAVKTLLAAGFTQKQIQEKFQNNTKQPKGVVYNQSPVGNTQVKSTRDVVLYVSKGAPSISMPDVTGDPVDQAKQSLVTAGISSKNISVQNQKSNSVPTGQVISSKPAAGSSVATDGKVVLTVSQQQTVKVPNIIGKTAKDAEKALKQAGLKVGKVTFKPINMPDKEVYYIYPYSEGQKVPVGSSVNMDVAKNPSSGAGANNSTTVNGTSNATENNTTSNGTGGGSSGPPQPHTEAVTVTPKGGSPTHVQIIVYDDKTDGRTVVNDKITKKKTWQVTLYLEPGHSGDLKIYENGQLVQDYPVQG